MTDNPVSEVAETVDETLVPDAVTDTADHPVDDDVPPKWAEKLIDQVEDIADKVTGEEEPHTEHTEHHDAPEHHEAPPADESPVSVPWTHKNPFKHSE